MYPDWVECLRKRPRKINGRYRILYVNNSKLQYEIELTEYTYRIFVKLVKKIHRGIGRVFKNYGGVYTPLQCVFHRISSRYDISSAAIRRYARKVGAIPPLKRKTAR